MNIKKYFPIIGILIFIYLLLKLDISKILKEISQANVLFILIAIFFVFIYLVTETLKWFVIARKQGIKIPFKDSFKINLITDFYSFITPSKLGTLFRVEYLKKYSKNRGKGFSNLFLDKSLDIFSIFFISILFLFILGNKFNFVPKHLLITFFLLGILIFLLSITKDRSKKILRIFYVYVVPKKMKKRARGVFDAFYEKMPRKRDILLFFVFNLINWLILYFITYLVGRSLGIDIPFHYFLAILPIGTIVALLPITINGLGTREASLISLFGLIGISATKVFSMSIINLFLTGVFPALIASFFLFGKKD